MKHTVEYYRKEIEALNSPALERNSYAAVASLDDKMYEVQFAAQKDENLKRGDVDGLCREIDQSRKNMTNAYNTAAAKTAEPESMKQYTLPEQRIIDTIKGIVGNSTYLRMIYDTEIKTCYSNRVLDRVKLMEFVKSMKKEREIIDAKTKASRIVAAEDPSRKFQESIDKYLASNQCKKDLARQVPDSDKAVLLGIRRARVADWYKEHSSQERER